jgi:hypothetical protein
MTTVADVRATGTELVTASMPILEPINAQEIFKNKLNRFGDNYSISNTSHLFRFLVALCGEAGAGSLKKEMLLPRLEQTLEATHFNDLDRLYGNSLGLPRLSTEVYALDPINEILTQNNWQEIRSKDSSYRERCLIWMRAIIEGPTPLGIRLAAEAAIGVECDVFERYKYVENITSDSPITVNDIGQTDSPNEFVIIPREPDITEQEKRRIRRLIDKLRPVNTIPSVIDGDYLRTQYPVANIASSSDRFNVVRLVTGRPDVTWPTVDLSQGYWIEGGVEKEAPTYAFMDRQESVTYLTIEDATSSSIHVGRFNAPQASLFSNLSSQFDPLLQFTANKAFTKSIAPVAVSIPWATTDQAPRNQIVVNNSYPIGYFAQANVEQFTNEMPDSFWSSVEALAPSTETLTLDLGRDRPINFIDFEITQKPIDFVIEYSSDAITWTQVEQLENFPVTTSVTYLPSTDNPWHYFEMRFGLVSGRYVRVTFTRREERFPLATSDYFPWSIDIRALRLMHIIPSVDQFIPDAGVDVLGNAYRTDIELFDAGNVIDDDDFSDETPTYWQSQPNPARSAVEALYFDMRTGFNQTTMSYLDRFRVSEITWTQNELDTGHYENGVVIDEVFIDPVTFGPTMNIYYSMDDTASWDDKLWIPISRRYKLKRGYHALPQPTLVKYIKLEFTDLAAVPYQPVEYPAISEIEFRRYPTWVQNYFNDIYPVKPLDDNVIQFDRININPLTFGFQQVEDALSSSYETVRNTPVDIDAANTEVQTFIKAVVAGQTILTAPQEQIEAQINVRSPVMWQDDLISQLDRTRALSRKATESRDGLTDTGFSAELGLPVSDPPVQSSVVDLSHAYVEKKRPTMFFPQRCRHGYQVVRASFDNKIAYYVAIKNVSFNRRDYTITFDEEMYVETLADEAHVEVNEFIDDGWRFIVGP